MDTPNFINNYEIFVPSLAKDILFKDLNIKQYKQIITSNFTTPFLDIGFNIALIDVIQNNCLEDILLTNFDKLVIAFQMHFLCFNKKLIKDIRQIKHPNCISIQEGLYNIECCTPSIQQEKEYTQYIFQNNINDSEILLCLEIAKYIKTFELNQTDINCSVNVDEKIKIVKNIPVNILAKCVKYIDSIKEQIKEIYKVTNKKALSYNISLLLP